MGLRRSDVRFAFGGVRVLDKGSIFVPAEVLGESALFASRRCVAGGLAHAACSFGNASCQILFAHQDRSGPGDTEHRQTGATEPYLCASLADGEREERYDEVDTTPLRDDTVYIAYLSVQMIKKESNTGRAYLMGCLPQGDTIKYRVMPIPT